MIDLHIHTNKSDGGLSPKEIIEEASLLGVSVISITDHDTIDAYDEELFEYARKKGIKIIPGVEISSKVEKAGVHILGYNFNWENEEFRKELEKIRDFRHEYLYEVGEKLEELGYIVNISKLDKIKSVTKAHISLDIIENKKNREKLISEFGYIPSKGEFIETIMNENCPRICRKEICYAKRSRKNNKKSRRKSSISTSSSICISRQFY